MKERTNEEQLDLFADLLEPAARIIADKEIVRIIKSGEPPVRAISAAIKRHKEEVVEILAILDGKDPKEYKVNALTIPVRLARLLAVPEVQEFFTSLSQKEKTPFGSAMESIAADAN